MSKWFISGALDIDKINGRASSSSRIIENQKLGYGSALSLAQLMVSEKMLQDSKFTIITRGSQAVEKEEKELSVFQAPVLGLGKVIETEHPELGCLRIDLDPGQKSLAEEIQRLLEDLSDESKESEIAYRSGNRKVPRLQSFHDSATSKRVSGPMELGFSKMGSLSNLQLQPLSRRKPEKGEVEVRIHATGLNFKDTMYVLGVFPGEMKLGQEFSGEIVSVGVGVSEFKVGDLVFGMWSPSFRSHLICPAGALLPKPKHISFSDAVTIPAVFLTAFYAFGA